MSSERVRQQLGAVWSNVRRIEDIATAKSFLRWFGRGVAWWWRHVLGRNRPRRARSLPVASLGLEVMAVGERATAVFGDFSPPPRRRELGHTDVILADADIDESEINTPVVVVSRHAQMAVPAFDPAAFNPIGWRRDVRHRVAALGPRHLLPSGIAADNAVSPQSTDKLRRYHHVVDVQAFHRSAEARAGALVRLAACGIPVHLIDCSDELRTLLGPELYGLMKSDPPEGDACARELLSIALRRHALQEHSLRSRARQLSRIAGQYVLPLPDVSVVLATKRPGCLPLALANVARQGYPRLELVLALHGSGFDDATIDRAVAKLDMPVAVVRVADQEPLGTVLNLATEAASGSFVTKMDDDDLYDAFHVSDLVLASEYSGAQLVGKYHEVSYLVRAGKTIETGRGQAERFTWHVSGAALLISRSELLRCGGWRRIPSNEDVALVDDVVRSGGAVYRTHGAGLVSTRHALGHPWTIPEERLVKGANRVHDGWRPDLAGMDDVREPPPIR